MGISNFSRRSTYVNVGFFFSAPTDPLTGLSGPHLSPAPPSVPEGTWVPVSLLLNQYTEIEVPLLTLSVFGLVLKTTGEETEDKS